ncbi:MAG: DUF4397 domain-containing protein [Gammaproteobacteria bacterium]|nr:DUF4397 domain-containing protein [Gammaproteobacteria bacterium]MBU2184636.1 DUF4397 domain-containing protein [Gammaproteobacteria bacterium]MBU2205698.1 DUF4397 domain-containing protein [Gammaproteobacteria bacterium]
MKATGLTSCVLLASALVLSACGGSSSNDSATAESFLQFYNGAAGTGNAILSAGDKSVGSATYGDVSSVISLEPDSYTLQVKDVATSASLLSKDLPLVVDNKALFILTQQGQQYDYLTVDVSRTEPEEGKFKLHLVNLSAQHSQLDLYMAQVGNGFNNADKLDSLSQNEVSTEVVNNDIGQYRFFLTAAGSQTPLFTTDAINFAYRNSYVLIVRDKFGPIANQLSLDIVLNSTTVAAHNDVDAGAQFRVYNSLATSVALTLDNVSAGSVAAGQLSAYQDHAKGDFSLSVRDADNNLLLNSALLSLAAGESKAVLLYNNKAGATEALAVAEKDSPQQKSHDLIVANLVADFDRLQFYFVRQNETIADARYHVKNLDFKKQQSLTLPEDYYAIALVQVAENGSTTLLDKTDLLQLTPGKHYILLAEQDDAAPSGYKLTLAH